MRGFCRKYFFNGAFHVSFWQISQKFILCTILNRLTRWGGSDRFGRQLACGGGSCEEGAEEVGVDVADFRLVGSIPPYFWELLQGVGTRNPPVCEKSWVVPPWIGRTLGGFRQRVTRWIAKMQPNRDVIGR